MEGERLIGNNMNRRDVDNLNRPLFGGPTSVDRAINLVVGALTVIMVVITLISAFAFPGWPPDGVNVFFAFVIVFICISHIILIYWYRQGDLEPKFRSMIYYNAFTIVMLCVAGNLYIHGVADRDS